MEITWSGKVDRHIIGPGSGIIKPSKTSLSTPRKTRHRCTLIPLSGPHVRPQCNTRTSSWPFWSQPLRLLDPAYALPRMATTITPANQTTCYPHLSASENKTLVQAANFRQEPRVFGMKCWITRMKDTGLSCSRTKHAWDRLSIRKSSPPIHTVSPRYPSVSQAFRLARLVRQGFS